MFGYREQRVPCGGLYEDKDGLLQHLWCARWHFSISLKAYTLSEVLGTCASVPDTIWSPLFHKAGELKGWRGLGMLCPFPEYLGRMEKVPGEPVEEIKDYLQGVRYDGKGESQGWTFGIDVLYFRLKGTPRCTLGPPEPKAKLKVYFSVTITVGKALQRLKRFKVKMNSVCRCWLPDII